MPGYPKGVRVYSFVNTFLQYKVVLNRAVAEYLTNLSQTAKATVEVRLYMKM